jgi:hypothetical protein
VTFISWTQHHSKAHVTAKFEITDILLSFFSEILRIGSPDYVPSEADILRARAKSSGIAETRLVSFIELERVAH